MLGWFIIQVLERVLGEVAAGAPLRQIKPPAAPLFSDLFEHVVLLEADALKPVANQGWTYDATQPSYKCWKTDQPGSALEFILQGKAILLMQWHIRGPMGQAKVQVDDLPPLVQEAWFDQTWGGYRMTTIMARDLKPGQHKVKIQLLSENNPQSTGHEFRLLGLGAAGVEAR